MPKDARQDALERAAAEERDLLNQKMEESGLAFIDHELPDDEDDPSKYKKTFLQSLKGLWPWSDEYYEAEAAEEEMDNLKAIRVERARAEDLLAMTKIGDHEKALDIMMAETNNDFFFFNKLKYQYEGEGKWEFEEPELNPFGVLEAQQRRNRIRRAFRAAYNLLDASQQEAMSATMNAMSNKGGQEESKTCPWKGKNSQGEFLVCRNDRMASPHKAEGEDKPKMLEFCCYHMNECVDESHDHDPVKIKTPNEAALCSECFMQKKPGQQLANIKKENAPGVGPSMAALMAGNQPGEGEAEEEDGLTEISVCEWKASKKEKHLRTWTCSNKVIRNPDTNALQHVCGWHAPKCLKSHTGGTSSRIEIPNEHGLCVMHHTSVFGEPPEEFDIPYPGMIVKKGKNAWMKEGHHWAAPRYKPFYPRQAEFYEEPDPPEDFIQMVIHQGKIAKWKYNKRKYGKQMATVIQSYWRMWKQLFAYKHMVYEKRRFVRLEATILMQCAGRRRLAINKVNSIRKKRNWAALYAQRHYRGFRARRLVRYEKACRRIQRFFHKIRIFKFKDAVILMVQLKRMSRRRHGAANEIQRVFRGFQTRLHFFQAKLWEWVRQRSARVITREIRAYSKKVEESKVVEFIYPTMEWAEAQCRKRLAKMLEKLLLARRARKVFIRNLEKRTAFVQRHVRGFIARKGFHKMRFLHKEMNKWVQPKYAKEFLERFFESHVFWLNDGTVAKKRKEEPPPPPPPTWLIREHLPPKVQDEIEVSNDDFETAMKGWFRKKKVPLLSSELEALKGPFANPATGQVEVARVEDYIMLSELPCRRHGRTLCGTCMFLGNCTVDKCRCQHYYPSDDKDDHKGANATSICRDCYHAAGAHRKCPLQLEEANQPRTMLSLMRAIREPDMSMPAEVRGVDFDDIVVPPEDPDDIQMRRDQLALKANQEEREYLSTYRMSTLALMLTFLEEKGEDVARIRDYWGQHNLRTVGDLTVDEHGRPLKDDSKANVNVNTNNLAPFTNISSDKFWEESAKNPNKSKRDYDEKFEHNMPMPVVVSNDEGQNDLTYTFEGSKVYLNILIQIIDIGEGKVPRAVIHYDNPDFLRLVMNHIQVFERHWRKMVADIRKGELNRNVLVEREAKAMFQALALPRPRIAEQLDQCFRDLGFHKKVLGKDIQVQKFAEKYRGVVPDPHARRPSLPMTPGGTMVGEDVRDIELRGQERAHGSMSRSGEYQPGQGHERAISRGRSPEARAARAKRDGVNSRSGGRGSRPGSRSAGGSGSPHSPHGKRSGSRGSGSRGGGPSLRNKTHKELLVMVGDSMKTAVEPVEELHRESRSRGPSRRTRADGRRGSDTDIARDASLNELHSINTELETEPRTGYHLTIETDGDRFVCPFPACGKSFKSKDAAFKHLPIHEQKIRLFAPTALPDSHLNFYWPRKVPWNKDAQFSELITPPGNYTCEEDGCGLSFTSKQKLEKHIARAHQKQPIDSTDFPVTWFKPQGDALCVPPYDAPLDVPIKYCRDHVNPSPYCMLCIALEKNKGPKPPYRFFDKMLIDFNEKEEANKLRYSEGDDKKKKRGGKFGMALRQARYRPDTGKAPVQIMLEAENRGKVVCFTKMVGVQSITKLGYVASIVVDKTTKCYVAVRPVLNKSDADALGARLPRDFDQQYEVRFMPHEGENLEEYCEWVPVGNVLSTYELHHTDKKQFRSLLKAKRISHKSYFTRALPEGFDDEQEQDGTEV